MTTHIHPGNHDDADASRDGTATAVLEVSGVQSVRVRVRRRKAEVRAVSHFRDLDEVRAELDATLTETVRGLGLSRKPALSVRVRKPGRKG